MDGDMDTDDASFFGVDDTINTSCPYSDDSTGILMFSFFQNTYTLLVSYIYQRSQFPFEVISYIRVGLIDAYAL